MLPRGFLKNHHLLEVLNDFCQKTVNFAEFMALANKNVTKAEHFLALNVNSSYIWLNNFGKGQKTNQFNTLKKETYI